MQLGNEMIFSCKECDLVLSFSQIIGLKRGAGSAPKTIGFHRDDCVLLGPL